MTVTRYFAEYLPQGADEVASWHRIREGAPARVLVAVAYCLAVLTLLLVFRE